MSVFKLSNSIFNFKLSASELSVYAYLCSLPSEYPMLDNSYAVMVKQSTIAQKCGIKAVQTVAKVITLLNEKGLVEPIRRSVKRNGYKGTYVYKIKKLPTNDSFFFVERQVFGNLIPRQMMIYLFMCKSYSTKLRDSWNSYNDISNQTGMKRETIIQTVSELVEMKYIVRCRRKSKENKKVFTDNHYQIVFFVIGKIRKKSKKRVRLLPISNRILYITKNCCVVYYTTFKAKCQVILKNFLNFFNRGSPQI